MFESHAAVGSHSTVIVYPRVEALPGWRLPPAFIEGSHAEPVRTPHTTPHATSIRAYAPGDAYNRIHWKSSARQGELQVKEFDLEQTADVWIFLDLHARAHTGDGDESTLEYGVRVAASIAARALGREPQRGADRVRARASAPCPPTAARASTRRSCRRSPRSWPTATGRSHEVLVEGVGRLRRGMTAVIITPSLERDWVRPLGGLRSARRRDVRSSCSTRPRSPHMAADRQTAMSEQALNAQRRARADARARALRHALAEHDLRWHQRSCPVSRSRAQLVSRGPRPTLVPRDEHDLDHAARSDGRGR